MFVLNPKQIHSLCDLIIKSGYGKLTWAYSRIDTLHDDEMLKKTSFRFQMVSYWN